LGFYTKAVHFARVVIYILRYIPCSNQRLSNARSWLEPRPTMKREKRDNHFLPKHSVTHTNEARHLLKSSGSAVPAAPDAEGGFR